MKKFAVCVLLICLFLHSCNTDSSKNATEKLKSEIIQTEQAFAEMAKKEGVPAAFLAFAAEDAVLNRNNNLLKGKDAIRAYFRDQSLQEIKLEWTPDFVDVAASGDLGYTYGHYLFSAVDTSGKTIQANGIFHTVWKKQPNGQWKFVWD